MSVLDHRFPMAAGTEPDASLPRMLRTERVAVGAASVSASRTEFHLQQVYRGFATGLLVVVPTLVYVSYVSGSFGDRPLQEPSRPAVVVSTVAVKPMMTARAQPLPTPIPDATAGTAVKSIDAPAVPVSSPSPPQVRDVAPPPQAPIATSAPPALMPAAPMAMAASISDKPAQPSAESVVADLLEEARALVVAGRVADARELLTQPDLETSAEAKYVLAETYDPNVLAALGITRIRAEPQRARALYEKALAEGLAAARHRIRALE